MPIRVRVGNQLMSASEYKRMRTKALRSRIPTKAKGRKGLIKVIKSVMKRNEETKYVSNAYDATGAVLPNLWYSTGTLGVIGNFNPAIPKLNQGVDDFERVGSKVSPVSCSVTLRIGLNPSDLSANSLLGVIYYGTDRANHTWAGQNPLATAAILDNGDGTNTIFSGQRYDLMKPIDKKLVNCKRIIFRLSKTPGIQNSDNGGDTTVGGSYATGNGIMERSFTLRFKPPKTLTYLLPGDTYPQNYAPFYAVGFCHADGSPLRAYDQTLVNVNSKVHLYYKDT